MFRRASTTAAAHSRRTITIKRSGRSGTASTPHTSRHDPTKLAVKPSAARSRSTLPRRQNEIADAVAPNTAWPLFVPSATCGGKPAASRAGSEINPPPPAIASTSPAKNAAATSSATMAEDGIAARFARAPAQKKFAARGPTSRRRPVRSQQLTGDPAEADVGGGRRGGKWEEQRWYGERREFARWPACCWR